MRQGSPKRTWAENGFFKCFHSTREGLLLTTAIFLPAQRYRSKGLRPVFFSPFRGVGLIVCFKSRTNDAPPPGFGPESRPH